jgi:hypothetical protein
LKKGLDDGKYTLIDVRPRTMVAEVGQIPGSNNIPRKSKQFKERGKKKVFYPPFVTITIS